MSAQTVLPVMLADVAMIVAVAAGLRRAAAGLGQPSVVGEMLTGILLGPSLLGWLAPQSQGWLFPAEARAGLDVLGQIGVGLYMFGVALKFPVADLKRQAGGASAIAVAGMAAPFLAALALTPWLQGIPGMFGAHASAPASALFLGTAASVTAFPVLARMLEERGLLGSAAGSLVISAGALTDALAWMMLALCISVGAGRPAVAILAVGGGLTSAVVGLLILPRLCRWLQRRAGGDRADAASLGCALAGFFLCAAATTAIGLHGVFGAFLLGLAIPRGALSRRLVEIIEPVAGLVLMPIFFTLAGLQVHAGLLTDPMILGAAAVIIAGSALTKSGGCYAAARLIGLAPRAAAGVGALMNARGAMELVLVNVGLQMGLVGPALYTILVLMALATTFMALPAFIRAGGAAAFGPSRSPGQPAFPPSLVTEPEISA